MNLKFIKSAKISLKLTMIYAFMFSLVLLALSTVTLYGTKYFLYKQADKQIEDINLVIQNKISSQEGNFDLASQEFFYDIPSKNNLYIRILNEDYYEINESRAFDYKLLNKKPVKTDGQIRKTEEEEKHILFSTTKSNSKKYGTIYIQVVRDLESEYDFMKILFMFMAFTDFVGIISSIIFGYIVSKRMLTPIDNITKTAENISANNLKERIDVKGPDDELNRLGHTINNMIDRLQKAFDSQSQFVSDASHELRTPIAVIQGYANLLDRWGKNDKEALEKSIYGIKYEADNMAGLVEKLLFLAKGDSLKQIVEKREFYLNELIDGIVEETRLIDKKHSIISNKNEVVKVYADSKLIKEMIRIFVENSIKFTADSGTITVNSFIEDNLINISITDTGIGIPKDEIENIFNRFYTVDKSRSKEKGGTGLGLSIAKWIVDVHHGTIEVNSEEGKGTNITVSLPNGNQIN